MAQSYPKKEQRGNEWAVNSLTVSFGGLLGEFLAQTGNNFLIRDGKGVARQLGQSDPGVIGYA